MHLRQGVDRSRVGVRRRQTLAQRFTDARVLTLEARHFAARPRSPRATMRALDRVGAERARDLLFVVRRMSAVAEDRSMNDQGKQRGGNGTPVASPPTDGEPGHARPVSGPSARTMIAPFSSSSTAPEATPPAAATVIARKGGPAPASPASFPQATPAPVEPHDGFRHGFGAGPGHGHGHVEPHTPTPGFTPPPVSWADSGPRQPDSGPRPPTGNWEDSTGVSSQANAPRPGLRIHQYELIREIGAGGMGTVFLARDTRLGRRVAIKFLQSNHPELTQRFLVEARATARCSHENIVIIYEVGEHFGSPYMVLEFLKGAPLTRQLERGQKLPYTRAVELMIPVLRALAVAHEQNIVHRDLKPDNIFVTEGGTVKVLDFGIAKVVQGDGPFAGERAMSSDAIRLPSESELAAEGGNTELTRRGTIVGTMKYMAPEQWGIGIEVDHRADVWAAGVLLYRMIAGRHPLYPLDGSQLVVVAMLDRPMPRLREAVSDVPRELADVIDRCLLKRKEDRWPSARELLAALEPFQASRFHTRELRIDQTPYAGLSSFQENDASRFFGRGREIAAMVTRLRDRPLMAVVGGSGVGKSSFVRAGVVPALKSSGEAWETLIIRPGRSPMAALANLVSPLVGTSPTLADEVAEQQKLASKLTGEPGHLGTLLRSRARRESRRILLFIDQFEELYTLVSDPDERAAFTACLAAVADDATAPLRVVLSIRADFLDRVSEDQGFLGELSQGLFFLGAPSRDGLRDALVQPAEMAGYQFEMPAIVEDMLDHLETTPGALPLLQFAAAKLWEQRDSARHLLTHHSYAAMGGIAGALASHADSVMAELSPQAQTLGRALFLRLVTPEHTRAIVAMDELRELSRDSGEIQRLLDQLVAARLLLVQSAGGDQGSSSTVEIVHESLIHSWPTLRRWLDETQDDAALLDQLRTAARQWQVKNRDPGLLWRGDTADEARRWYRRYHGPLSDVQKAYLDAVFAQALSAQRRRRQAVITGFAAMGVLITAAVVALIVIRGAKQAADRNAIAAQHSAVAATTAQKQAEQRLAEVQRKEAERLAAEAQRQAAERREARVSNALDLTSEELRKTNEELLLALDEANASRERAKRAKETAEDNAEQAVAAQKEAEAARQDAVKAKDKVEQLLAREKARAKKLEDQLGSPIVDTLK
jgi:serine/threonine protein kinase